MTASVSVAVVGICGARDLARCLDALARQQDAPPFEVVVAYDPALADVAALEGRYPQVRLVANAGQRTPLELASRAIRESRGTRVLLTEDHCIPAPDWVARLLAAMAPGRAAVGGRVRVRPGTGPVDWAFYFVDFFRYAGAGRPGPAPSLTVCNVAYRREDLDALDVPWHELFHETAVNDGLRRGGGELWLDPRAEVSMQRHVRFADALRERYAFGRLFGCTRLDFSRPGARLAYVLLAPALPVLLLGRMAHKALTTPGLRRPFLTALPALTAMVLAWSWGEWLGYATRKRPDSLVAAQEAPRDPQETRAT